MRKWTWIHVTHIVMNLTISHVLPVTKWQPVTNSFCKAPTVHKCEIYLCCSVQSDFMFFSSAKDYDAEYQRSKLTQCVFIVCYKWIHLQYISHCKEPQLVESCVYSSQDTSTLCLHMQLSIHLRWRVHWAGSCTLYKVCIKMFGGITHHGALHMVWMHIMHNWVHIVLLGYWGHFAHIYYGLTLSVGWALCTV